jgi:hypothetical protein
MVTIDELAFSVDDLLDDYKNFVDEAVEEGLDDAQKLLINNLSAKSPVGKTGKYAKAWKGKGKTVKHRRFIHNTKMVPGKRGRIPLSNILEYSYKSKHQGLIKRTYQSSEDGIANAIWAKVKRGG